MRPRTPSAAVHALAACLLGLAVNLGAMTGAQGQNRADVGADVPMPIPQWSGLYVGGHLGFADGRTTDAFTALPFFSFDNSIDGAVFGGHLGYNLQFGAVVVGIEGSLSGADIDGSAPCLFVFSCQHDVEWLATLVGRTGYAIGRSLIYAMGGIAWAGIDTDMGFAGCTCLEGSTTQAGWLIGLGLEYAITERVSARIEYAHIDLGSDVHDLTPPGGGFPFPPRVSAELDTLRVGASIKLGN